jgi:transcriptional regulator with XRE-family HTH domain
MPTELTLLAMAALISGELQRQGMTQAEFARRVGVTEKHVSRVLTGKNGAAMATLDYWAFVLGCRFVVALERRDDS